jgi:hypothetical protein
MEIWIINKTHEKWQCQQKNKHVAKSQIHNDVDIKIYHKQKKQQH